MHIPLWMTKPFTQERHWPWTLADRQLAGKSTHSPAMLT